MEIKIGDKMVSGELNKNGVFVIKCSVIKDEKGNVNIRVPCLKIKKEI